MPHRKLTVLVATMVGVALAAVFATAAVPAVYQGNMCGRVYASNDPHWWVDQVGSEACIDRGAVSAGRYFYMTPLAFDYARNGHGALNDWRVMQYYNGGWRNYKASSCYVSAGAGYSNVCGQILVQRVSGATRVALLIQSCNYDSDVGVRRDCSGYQVKVNNAW
jgi:hypothetical protein